MNTNKRGILMMSAPAVAAVLMAAMLVGATIPNATDKFSESLGATGYVVISVVRDGNEIYHYEDHNLITNAGRNFIAQELGDSANAGTAAAEYIAVSTNVDAPAATDTTLTGEIASGGLERAQGTFAHVADTDSWTISNTFTASAGHTAVQKAGLFTAASSGTMMAENTFSSVNLASGDQLTITWTIDLGL